MYKIPIVLLLFLLVWIPGRSQVVAAFAAPSSACVGSPVTVKNTTTGGTSYFWSFCAADFSQTPQATDLGNPSGVLNAPVFGSYVEDESGNFFGIVTNYFVGRVSRLSFGNSLLNAPTAEDLGDFGGVIPIDVEGLQLVEVNGNWTAVIVGGSGEGGPATSYRIVKLDFGVSLTSTPVATNWGNIGGLSFSHDFFILFENGNYYGLTENITGSTLSRINFGPDFTGTPTGVNLGNIGNLNYPCGLTYIKYNGSLYVYIVNRLSNSISRLDFGNSITNTPTGTEIPNPGYLNFPRDIDLFTTCTGTYGFVTNEATNEMVKLNFGSDPLSVPTATDLGTFGILSFPHSMSNLFRVGNDIYAFVHNVTSSSLTLLRFAGCQNIPGSALQNPAPVTYTSPGVYTVNLLVDVGLPTQASYCQQITVNPLPAGRLTGDTVCFGGLPAVFFTGEAGVAPYSIGYTDGQSNYSQNNLNGQSPITAPYSLSNVGAETFELQTILDGNGCQATIDSSTTVLVRNIPQGGISGNVSCSADSVRLLFQGTGSSPFALGINAGVNSYSERGVTAGKLVDLPPVAGPTTYTLFSITDSFGCARTAGFTNAATTVTVFPSPVLNFDSLQPVCLNKSPFLITAGSETSGLSGTGGYSGDGINAAGDFSPSGAGPGEHLLIYTYSTATCSDSIQGGILVNPLPMQVPASTVVTCGVNPVQLSVGGGVTYGWSPAQGLNNPGIANPIANADTTTTYIATVTDGNGCLAYDTVAVDVIIGGKNFFRVPNAFSPNGDGHNDCWGIQYWPGVTVQELDVFNRWGGIVFTTKNPDDCWNGTFNGQVQPAGAYVYVIRAATPCGLVTRTGAVFLVR
jgi:gliding motility-associated-like protein